MSSILPPTFEKPQTTHESSGVVNAAARKINSSKLRTRLLDAYKKDLEDSCRPKNEASRRFAKVFNDIGSAESMERALLTALDNGFSPSLQALEEWTQKTRAGRGWESFEDFFGDVGEDMRFLNPEMKDQVVVQLGLGLITGGYRAIKGIVSGVLDLINLVAKLIHDPETQKKLKALGLELAAWSLKLQFGNAAMQVEARKQFCAVFENIWDVICTSFTEQWEKARDEGREVEFVSAWILQAGIEVPSLVLGAKKAAALAASAATKTVKAAPKLGRFTMKQADRLILKYEHVQDRVHDALVAKRRTKYITKTVSPGRVYRLVGPEAEKLIRAAPPKVREKLLKDFSEFYRSDSKRPGVRIEGQKAFLERQKVDSRYYDPADPRPVPAKIVEKMIRVLRDIHEGKPVKVFMVIANGEKAAPTKFVDESLKTGLKGPGFEAFQKAKGWENRLGPGRYVTVEEYHTPAFEVNPKLGQIPAGRSILSAEFQPGSRLNHNFRIFPSVREPGGGINILDADLKDYTAFKNVKVVWETVSELE